MCGIFGIFSPTRPVADHSMACVREMGRRMRHRGPDGLEIRNCMEGRAILGHTRLAIIDLAGGAQPLWNEDETVCVICNGEIYNHVEVRNALSAKGHKFRTKSDCETLVHLYEEYGEDMLDYVQGMYAFALLDAGRRLLLMARDRFGEKPLYFARLSDGSIAFASEFKALMAVRGLEKHFDQTAIAAFLMLGYIPAPRTHVSSVSKVRAGEMLRISSAGDLSTSRYWQPAFIGKDRGRFPKRAEAIEAVRHRLRESVRLRLRSDVPVGAFLSGGIDSTAIACAFRDVAPAAKITTFVASFDDARLNEAPFARDLAARLGTDHHEVHVSSAEMLAFFDDAVAQFDEPFGDPSLVPTYAVCKRAREACKVMLSGDGGDEIFAGYRTHFQHYQWNWLRRTPFVNLLGQLVYPQWNNSWRGRNTLSFLSKSDEQLVVENLFRDDAAQLLSPDCAPYVAEAKREQLSDAARHLRLPFPESLLESDMTHYLPEQILVKVDRASMAFGLESRAPFLDHGLQGYVAALPIAYNFRRGHGKALLRDALPDWVPNSIRWRDKQGFTPPMGNWIRGSLREAVEDTIFNLPGPLLAILQPAQAQRRLREHLEGRDHTDFLFRWYMLVRQCSRVLDNSFEQAA